MSALPYLNNLGGERVVRVDCRTLHHLCVKVLLDVDLQLAQWHLVRVDAVLALLRLRQVLVLDERRIVRQFDVRHAAD